ncbi:MAG TPA: hypothetical protein VGG30_11060, partial [Pirellulales bacterium]
MHRLCLLDPSSTAGQSRKWLGIAPLLSLTVFALLQAGCRPAPKVAAKPAAVTVRIGVVDDPGLTEAIRKLKAEWHAVTGNTLEVVGSDALDAVNGDPESQADALIIPAGALGTLVEADRLAAVPTDVRQSEEAAWSDIFLLVQQGAVWGDGVWAVPLGSPQLTLLYRRDLFEVFNRTPPTTWAEYQELVRFFSQREKLADSAPPADSAWHGTLEPLGSGWGARLLLARSAAYAKHRDNYSTLFDIETFKPLVAGPPFVRALEELVAARRGAPSKSSGETAAASEINVSQAQQLDVAGVRTAFLVGQSAMALTWPTAVGESEEIDVKVGFAELPGAAQMFNFASGKWDDRTAEESVHVPLVPMTGRLGVVLKSSQHQETAFDLLAWL